jgi:hypothetical protein
VVRNAAGARDRTRASATARLIPFAPVSERSMQEATQPGTGAVQIVWQGCRVV